MTLCLLRSFAPFRTSFPRKDEARQLASSAVLPSPLFSKPSKCAPVTLSSGGHCWSNGVLLLEVMGTCLNHFFPAFCGWLNRRSKSPQQLKGGYCRETTQVEILTLLLPKYLYIWINDSISLKRVFFFHLWNGADNFRNIGRIKWNSECRILSKGLSGIIYAKRSA